ncbi:hypothetical protein REPUB_Repub01dG0013600 [Reevesia pubescens]
MALATTDELLAIFMPILVYWIYSGFYLMLESLENYKLHSKQEEDEKNLVSRMTVLKGVLLHQISQSVVMFLSFKLTGGNDTGASVEQPFSYIALIRQLVIAMVVIDTWAYFIHRLMHYKFLYKYVHAQHHRIVVPYSYGGHYMHPVEGFLDTLGGSITLLLSGMSPKTSMFFFCFAIIKLVDDHCGMKIPGNPFHIFFTNNSAYHDVHHQLYGTKYNFAVYFAIWDRILGTEMPYSLEKKAKGGFEVRLEESKND